MADTYRAIVCRGFGAGETALEHVPRVALQHHEVRVQLAACGVNFPDVLIVAGKYQLKPELPFVPGIEAAGSVIEVGAGASMPRRGDAVMVSMRTGGYAEETVVPATATRPLPQGFSCDEGATFWVAHMTAYHGIATCGQVAAGQRVLVLGAGGGVGRSAVQIAKHLGASVIGGASSNAKRHLALSAGVDAIVDPNIPDLPAAVINATGGHGVDVVYDPVGLAPEVALRCLAWGGRVLLIGFAGGTIPRYEANRVLLKGASIIGVRAGEFGRRFPERRAVETTAILKLAAVHRPVVTHTYPLADFRDALRALESRQATGRLVLRP